MIRSILFSKGRLRSGWRAAAFLFAFISAALILSGLAQVLLFSLGIDATIGSSTFLISRGLSTLVPALVFGWLCGRFLEQVPFRALGASFSEGWFLHWQVGITIGAVTLCAAVIVAMTFGGLRFEMNAIDGNAVASLALSFLVFGIASAFEEALFRGYVLQTFARSGLAWLAILLTSVFFGAVHLGNPAAGVVSTLNTVLAGVWFGIAYLKTRDLWFVWGIHLMWNWMQGSIFGIEVSGLTNIGGGKSLLREIDAGPTWLTGETYGVEGGIVCTLAILISIVAIHFLPIKPDKQLLAMTTEPEPSA